MKAGLIFPKDRGRSEQNATTKRRKYNESNVAKKGEFNMAEHEKPQGHFFMGFLIGGVLGALAGIFFAPKSGKELRSDIQEKGNEVLKDAKEFYFDAGTIAKEIIETTC